jgi:hypothetical protein
VPDKELRILEDDQGWLYVYRLLGSPDYGPYLKEELLSMFEIEPEPWIVRNVRMTPPSDDSGDSDDASSG